VKGRWQRWVQVGLVAAFAVFVAVSALAGFAPGRRMGLAFGSTLMDMMRVLPCAFLLIGLFEVWVRRETVERHLGRGAGLGGYLWALLLGGMTVGGMYLAFPVAAALFRKGARLSILFAYVGFAGVCRIPMTTVELTFMGPVFTAVRLGISIPLVALTAAAMGAVLERRGYRLSE